MAVELLMARFHCSGREVGSRSFPPDLDENRALADSEVCAVAGSEDP